MFTKATKDVTLIDPIKILPEEGKSTTMKEGETQKFRYELTPGSSRSRWNRRMESSGQAVF